jgi:DnaJ-domain-containing protein 1
VRAPAWWRRREVPIETQQAAPGVRLDDDVSISSPEREPRPSFLDTDPTPEQLVDADRAAEYSAWAERLREKRETAKRRISGSEPQQQSYWEADHVFRESARVAEEELATRPDPLILTGKLGVLGLDDSASAADIERAYRRLAKQHHPDFHHDADEMTRTYHADQMRQINEAYRALKHLR